MAAVPGDDSKEVTSAQRGPLLLNSIKYPQRMQEVLELKQTLSKLILYFLFYF